ncbi:MAG: dihydrolipoamide acetyltransferase family protein [Planctomycetota bacterium]
MLQKIVMPALGQTVTEALIEKWHKREGDAVRKGEVLLEITTDKATLEVESFFDGILLKILHAGGEIVLVNRLIAVIGPAGTPIPADFLKEEPLPPAAVSAAPAPAPVPAGTAAVAAPGPALAATAAGAAEKFISPRARRLAADRKVAWKFLAGGGPGGRIVEVDVQAYLAAVDALDLTPAARALAAAGGVDLRTVTGTGPGGRIVRGDVAAAIPPEPIPLTAIERITAARLTQSFRDIPQFSLTYECDMTRAQAAVKAHKAAGTGVTMTVLLVKALADALGEFPRVGAVFQPDNTLAPMRGVHIGLAVGLESGELVVPVIRNIQAMDLAAIARASRDLIDRARVRKLKPDELTGGVLTISNLGMFGVTRFVPIINPGEPAIIGVGAVREVPVVRDGAVTTAPVMDLSIACDHRSINGVLGARFMQKVREIIEQAGKS